MGTDGVEVSLRARTDRQDEHEPRQTRSKLAAAKSFRMNHIEWLEAWSPANYRRHALAKFTRARAKLRRQPRVAVARTEFSNSSSDGKSSQAIRKMGPSRFEPHPTRKRELSGLAHGDIHLPAHEVPTTDLCVLLKRPLWPIRLHKCSSGPCVAE